MVERIGRGAHLIAVNPGVLRDLRQSATLTTIIESVRDGFTPSATGSFGAYRQPFQRASLPVDPHLVPPPQYRS
jgi:hypothetical protein